MKPFSSIRFSVLLVMTLAAIPHIGAQPDETPSSEKATVYFTRAGAMGVAINFTYFDGDKAIGRFNGGKYMKYECEPGKHLFWARSENKVFVEADLAAGETYVIDVIPGMGGYKASVNMIPVNADRYKMKKIQKLLSKSEPVSFDQEDLVELQLKMQDVILRGMEKYDKMKSKNRFIPSLTQEMAVSETDLQYSKQ